MRTNSSFQVRVLQISISLLPESVLNATARRDPTGLAAT